MGRVIRFPGISGAKNPGRYVKVNDLPNDLRLFMDVMDALDDATVGDVDPLDVHREILAEALANG